MDNKKKRLNYNTLYIFIAVYLDEFIYRIIIILNNKYYLWKKRFCYNVLSDSIVRDYRLYLCIKQYRD